MITSSPSDVIMSGTSAVAALTTVRARGSKHAIRKASCGSILLTIAESRGNAASTLFVTASSRSSSSEPSKYAS